MQNFTSLSKLSIIRTKQMVLTFCLSGLFMTFALAQTTSISGVVTSANDGEPLIGVTVTDVNNPTNGTITDLDGNFTLSGIDQNSSILISYIGFKTITVDLTGEGNLSIALEEDISALDEVVVVGYGAQKKATVTGAVTSVQGPVLEEAPTISVSNSLAGRLPGLVVIQTSGEPGSDEARIRIRGTGTLGNDQPLIVIDGIPDREGGIGRLNGIDIANISVLKDASAAIYGARAANGALIVTTKQGNVGKPEFRFTTDFGWAQPTKIPEMANAVEYTNIMNQIGIYNSNVPVEEWGAAWNAITTTGSYTIPGSGEIVNANFSPQDVEGFRTQSDEWLYPDEDWFDATFKEWSPQQRYNMSISGGTENVRYYSSLGYMDQDAYYKNSATRYQQYNFRINTDIKINNYISTKLGVMYRKEDRRYPTQSAGAIFRMLMRGRPTEPAIWPTGEPGPDIENGQQPVVITTNATGYNDRPTDFIQFTGSLDITQPWIDGLKLTLLTGVDQNSYRFKQWQTPWDLYYLDRETYINTGEPILEAATRSSFTDPRLSQASFGNLNINLTALLNYDFKVGSDHTFNLLAGVTREDFRGDFFSAFSRNFISTSIDQLFFGGVEGQTVDGSGFERARLGYYGRAQYNYREKYLAEFIWRYDGSYIFPESDRFGFFPGVLVGWNMSNEDWFDVPSIDYLKLRASYGQMGNDQVFFNNQLQEFAYLSTYSPNLFPINGIVVNTLQEALLNNPNFTWERANNFNLGLDAILLNNKLSVVLEYFYNRRDQILIQETGSTPASSGISDILPPVNAGKVDNSGFEFNLVYYGGQNNELSWDVGINGGYAKNEIVFMDEVPGAPEYQLREGKPIGAYLVYEYDGVFRDQDDIAANTLDYSAVTSNLRPGDMKFKDINGDGIIDADDQVRLEENIVPKFNYGATFNAEYKNFGLSLLFQGAVGASFYIQTESGDIGNYLKHSADNHWNIENPSSTHPRLASRGDTYYSGGSYGNNTYNLYSKDYLRLKNVQLSYKLPENILNPIGITEFRVYGSANNILTWADQDIFDPESENSSGQFYPQARVINLGLSFKF